MVENKWMSEVKHVCLTPFLKCPGLCIRKSLNLVLKKRKKKFTLNTKLSIEEEEYTKLSIEEVFTRIRRGRSSKRRRKKEQEEGERGRRRGGEGGGRHRNLTI